MTHASHQRTIDDRVPVEAEWFTCEIRRHGPMEFQWSANAVGHREVWFRCRFGGRLSIAAWQNSGGPLTLRTVIGGVTAWRDIPNCELTSVALRDGAQSG